ncbi:MAG TPA: glycosyltransferase [Candidatus Saccharimonadales bacterium]|nr:glycosyltransferase [Candidatus Saccharimonadales bacterium]
MKIGIVIDRLNVGGVEKIAIEEVIALRQLGEDAQLVVLREKAVVQNAFPDLLHDVPVVYLDKRLPKLLRFSFPFPVFSFFSLFHITYPLFLPFVVKKKEFDYFIVHGTYTCFSVATISKIKKIQFSAFIWDPISYILTRVYNKKFFAPLLWLLKKIAYTLDKFLINSMDTVLVGGSAHNAFIRRINQHKPIKAIYPAVHPLKRLLKKDDYVLMVTAWKDGKDPEYIFEIIKKLPGIHIKMVGKWTDPLYRQKFEKIVQEKGYNREIEIVGAVSESQLFKYYAQARVLLQTNDDRGFGMPAMEAAGCGTTFIIPRGQGVCDLFIDGEDGFYTKEKDTKTICTLLKRLLENPELATSIGNKAWNHVRNNYSWEKHALELKQIINENLSAN